jgi:hypothetical protein
MTSNQLKRRVCLIGEHRQQHYPIGGILSMLNASPVDRWWHQCLIGIVLIR